MKIFSYRLVTIFLSIAIMSHASVPNNLKAEEKKAKSNELSLSIQQRKEVQQIINKYLRANPEIIVDSIRAMQERQNNLNKKRIRQNLERYKKLIFNDPTSPVAGSSNGDVTVVEFLDYSCGYCKRFFPNLKKIMDEDKNIRFVFKEFPILSRQSELAARAALAVWRQDKTKYMLIHSAFIDTKGAFTISRITRIAKNIGLNITQLKKDMGSSSMDKIIAANRRLAQNLGITGTPGFIIGDKIIPGALDITTLKRLIADARGN